MCIKMSLEQQNDSADKGTDNLNSIPGHYMVKGENWNLQFLTVSSHIHTLAV